MSDDYATPGWSPVAIGFTADLVGLLTFYSNVSTNETAKLLVAGTLAAVAVIAGLVVMAKAARLWMSPKGTYVPAPYLRTKAVAALGFIVVGVGLGVLVVLDAV